MRSKNLAKGVLAAAALALTIMAAPASLVMAEETQGTYTVEKDDNLSKIAKKVYRNEKFWRVIYDANAAVVKSDYIIYKGQQLVIPALNDTSAPAAAVTAPDPAPATPAATPAPAPATPAATPNPTPAAPVAAAPAQEQAFTLDYSQIASWVTGGFVGQNAAGETVVMGTDADDEYGIIIFADNSNMTAASFVGPITYDGDYMTITDESNGLALTFTVAEIGDGILSLDMGNLGTVAVQAQVQEVVLNFIRTAIEAYTHVA